MRKVNVFLALMIVALASLAVLVAAGYFIFTSPVGSAENNQSNWMSNMWGSMMSGYTGVQTVASQNSAWPILGVGFIVLICVAIVGVGGLSYFLGFPEIKFSTPLLTKMATVENAKLASNQPVRGAYDSVAKTLTADERIVLEVLTAHDGCYLQKYIRAETGLSRLQTHRILARLSSRGVVTLQKTGNTNQVLLADWLRK